MAERHPHSTVAPRRRTDGESARRRHILDAATGVLGYTTPATTATPPSPVTVEIENVIPPATFSRLSTALDALWESLRALPLGFDQYDGARQVLGPGAVHKVEEALAQGGELTHRITMGGQSHIVSVRTSKASQ